MGYETIAVKKLAGSIGAEIAGVDLRRASNQAWSEIHRAFLENLVIVFRDQALEPGDGGAGGRCGAEPSNYPFVAGSAASPKILEITRDPKETTIFDNAGPPDTPSRPRPPLATLLYAKETPERGGDTLFANQY